MTEALPELRSVAVGFWVGSGSRDEVPERAGVSHFLEHLLFKGTEDRTARQIAEAVESVGGAMNAFTTQEYTAFYVRVPDDRLELALDILSAVIWTPAFRPDDVEAERQVILEEIRMREDVPEDLVHELFAAALFPDHPLGREIIGTPETVGSVPREGIAAHHGDHYRPANVVVAAAGNLDHDAVTAMVAERLGPTPGDRPARVADDLPPSRALSVLTRPTEQAHLVVGTRALSRGDDDRYALAVLNQAFGGGMSSRLFQEVREERGLAYSVYSYWGGLEETGVLGVYAGTAPGRVDELLAVLDDQLDRLTDGLTDEELDSAKGHLRGATALSLETSSSRMHRLGRSELTLGEVPTLDEVTARIDAVEPDDVDRVVERVFTGPRTLAVVGPLDEADLARWARE
ncbi:MAG: insulinase family protein [Acidimicrobiia bacterium]|nr:insulinase family protein [Acidimicrobiia bacterium]